MPPRPQPAPIASPPPPPAAAPPEPIPDFIRDTLNLRVEDDQVLVNLANEENAVLVCAIAPYRSVRVSPVEEVSASIGLHEEFAFEALIDEINEVYTEAREGSGKMIFLLNSPGGGMHSAFKVARAIREAFSHIEVFVPHVAASGGTMIALTGDKIIMGRMSQLSPLDPQVMYKGSRISALAFRHAYNRLSGMFAKKTKDEAPYPQQALTDKLDPFIMEEWNATIQTAEVYVKTILQLSGYQQDVAEKIARALVTEFPAHDADINCDMAKELGIRAERNDESERNNKIWRLFRAWLGKYLFEEAGTHVLRYIVPTGDTNATTP